MVALFYFDSVVTRWVMLGLFATAGITDFFDGYLARTRGEFSRLGRFLDPVADKLLVGALIFMLAAFDRISGLMILLVILIREIMVSGLREFLAELQVSVPVSRLAKWKTTIQMLAIGFLIVGDAAPDFIPAVLIGDIGIWLAAALTLFTGYDYFQAGIKHMIEEESPPLEGKDSPKSGTSEKSGQ